MALLIDLWYVTFLELFCSSEQATQLCCRAALILGIQYLTFQAFPIIFEQGHGFNVQETGLSFAGMGLGIFIGLAVQPLFIRYARML